MTLSKRFARWGMPTVLVIAATAVFAPLGSATAATGSSDPVTTATAGSTSAHQFALTATAEPRLHDCAGESDGSEFGSGIGSCNLAGSGWNRIDWMGDRGGGGTVGIAILSGGGSVLDGSMPGRGSDKLSITAGSIRGSGATGNITTGTSGAAGQVDGPLKVDVKYSVQRGFTFTITGYLNYDEGGTVAEHTTTTLTALPTASAGQKVTYRADVSPTNEKAPQTYGTFRFTFSAKVRLEDNCRRALEDSSGRAFCTVSYPQAGTFTATASFSGTDHRDASRASVPQVVDDRPYLNLEPSKLTFSIEPGKTSLAQSVLVSAAGKAGLVISSVAIEDSSDFHVAEQDCTGTTPIRKCTILVTASHQSHGKLVITDNAANGPQTVDLD